MNWVSNVVWMLEDAQIPYVFNYVLLFLLGFARQADSTMTEICTSTPKF